MTDPLGQSQVIPYIIGLTAHGHQFHLISFEKEGRFLKREQHINAIMTEHNIVWHPIRYTKSPPVVSTMYDLYQMRKKAHMLHGNFHFDLVHCRSYISALVGLWLKKALNIPFLFDMRGFWPDERVDGGLWNLKNPIYKLVYRFFKQKEIEFLKNAAATISLTNKAKLELIDIHESIKGLNNKIFVIPCCADTTLFSKNKVDHSIVESHKSRLGLAGSFPIIVYLGSIGTWYMLEEMLDFFSEFKNTYKQAKFVFITPDKPEFILQKAKEKSIQEEELRIFVATREELPSLLALADLSIFFIRPSYSKMASSPTKQGELMSMGIPVICNSGVGDTDEIVKKYNSGILIKDFALEDYQSAIMQLEKWDKFDKKFITAGAQDYFSLEKGVEKYQAVYQAINNNTD